jgi:hypothetical protein
LYSSKYLDYLDWKKAALLILNNNHYTDEGIINIDNIRNIINIKRSDFRWNHLYNL